MVCYLRKLKGHITPGVRHGAHLPDPANLLTGAGKDMGHVKFPLGSEIDIPACPALIEAAVRYDAG